MRFDQTSIAIRERNSLEVFDLAANVVVRHFRPILFLLVLNATPFILLDYYLVGWMTDVSFSAELSVAYYVAMLTLIVSQAQLGTCLITIFMGRVMFLEEHSVRAVLKQFYGRMTYFLYSQGILRTAAFAIAAAWITQADDSEEAYMLVYLGLPAIVFVGLLVRGMRPYVPEVIFLEQTPLKKRTDLPSLSERSKNLHMLAAGAVSNQFMLMAVIAPLLVFAVHSIFILLDSLLSIRANSEMSMQPFYLLIAAWLVAGFCAVVRFLMYIDIRIRQEGWAVQLKFMTENSLLNQSLEN